MADAAKSRSEAPAALPTWPDEIYRVLKDAGVRQVAMVPDAGHSRLIRSFEADPETRVVTLTTEEEGVAMLAGALACTAASISAFMLLGENAKNTEGRAAVK